MVDVDIRVRQAESAAAQPDYQWDTQFNPATQTWDWVLAGYGDPTNVGGLLTTRPIDTAVIIQLATWRRAEAYDNLPSGNDPRGWWGDSVDIDTNEGPLGSRLWLLYRAVLNANTAQLAENYATEALQTFVKQGVWATFTVATTIDKPNSKLVLTISAFSQDGARVYQQQFARLWAAEQQSFTPTPSMAGGTPL